MIMIKDDKIKIRVDGHDLILPRKVATILKVAWERGDVEDAVIDTDGVFDGQPIPVRIGYFVPRDARPFVQIWTCGKTYVIDAGDFAGLVGDYVTGDFIYSPDTPPLPFRYPSIRADVLDRPGVKVRVDVRMPGWGWVRRFGVTQPSDGRRIVVSPEFYKGMTNVMADL